jgi:hypothetical protein
MVDQRISQNIIITRELRERQALALCWHNLFLGLAGHFYGH